jgi:CRISPR-associated protein Cas6
VVVGRSQERELLAHGTLYAHLVALDSLSRERGSAEVREDDAMDETSFLATIDSELAAMNVRCRRVCGRWQALDTDALLGCSLMLDGLTPEDSLRVLERGLGAHRRLGCGLFVPHKSTAAVGTPL